MCIIDFVRLGSRSRILAHDIPVWISNNKRGRYIAAVCVSAPPWIKRADFADFAELIAERDRMRDATGERYVLDHVVPINHPNVCGLTVPWNLRVVHWRVNGAKSNRFTPDQLELF